MTCGRCGGLMTEDYWMTDDGAAGIDWRCVLCSLRVPLTWRRDYDPLRPMSPKKHKYAPDPDEEFVLTRTGEFYHKRMGV